MKDLELTEICAKWMGLEYHTTRLDYITDKATFEKFDPLNNWQQFMEMVVPKLPQAITIGICKGIFVVEVIERRRKTKKIFPSDLRQTVLEMISKMEAQKI